MATQRTVTKVIFHDSSDDEADTNTSSIKAKKPLVATTIIDVRTDTLCMDEDDMVDPEEHFRRTENMVGDDAEDLFVEDALPDLEKAKGTLASNHSNLVEVQVMDAPVNRAGGFVANRTRPGKRPEDATSAHSTRKRLRDDDEAEEGGANANSDGMTTEEMLAAAEAHGLPAPATGAVDALDTLEEEVVKAVMLPNGTHREPLAIKLSGEGYRLSLDENDVQEIFEDEDDVEDEEAEDEETVQLELLMAISAIEQMIGACERYQPNVLDGGMCPWAEESEGGNEENAAKAEGDDAKATEEAAPAVAVTTEEAPVAAATAEPAPPAVDAAGNPIIAKRLIHRPRIFDAFVEKGKDLLAKLQAQEITADEVCDTMAEDVEALQRAFRRINRPSDEPIFIDGVKMDF